VSLVPVYCHSARAVRYALARYVGRGQLVASGYEPYVHPFATVRDVFVLHFKVGAA